MATMKEYKEGNNTYTNDGKNIYKNGSIVSKDSYKYIPTQVGGSRAPASGGQNSNSSSSSTTYKGYTEKGSGAVQDYLANAGKPNYTQTQAPSADYDKVMQNNPWFNQQYGQMQGAIDKYTKEQQDMINQNKYNQLAQLQAEYDKLKNKYEGQYNTDRNQALQNYDAQNKQIDDFTYQQYERSKQQGVMRGVSSSAQAQAMDNAVTQHSTTLFNQNASDRDKNLSDLTARINTLMGDLDGNTLKQKFEIEGNALNQMSQVNQQAFSQTMQMHQNKLGQTITMMEKENDRLFKDARDKDAFMNQISVMTWQAGLQDAQAVTQIAREMAQYKEKAKIDLANQKDLAKFNFELQKKLASHSASLSGGGGGRGGSGGSGDDPSNPYGLSNAEWQNYLDNKYAYYISSGLSYEEAMRRAQIDASNYFGKGKTPEMIKKEQQMNAINSVLNGNKKPFAPYDPSQGVTDWNTRIDQMQYPFVKGSNYVPTEYPDWTGASDNVYYNNKTSGKKSNGYYNNK